MSIIITRAGWILSTLLVWQLIVSTRRVSPLILPSLQAIGSSFWSSLITGDLVRYAGVSISLVLAGGLIGTLLAAVLAVAAYQSKFLAGGIDTLTAVAHPLPGIALLPLVILWSGTGITSVLVIIVHSVIWPMTINLRSGFSSVHQRYIDVGRNYGFSRLGIMLHIMIPASWSYMLAGLRIAWARSWRAVISAEMIFGVMGASGGLGWYIFQRRVFMDTAGMYAGIAVLIMIGLVIEDHLFRLLEHKTISRWGGRQ
ncbi:MAG: ABC transporter permease [Spirochaetia bacterium]|nr:ABC transporter permease [Spirochaetia bacterium]